MTIIIGLLCKNGVVIGADSSATLGDLFVHTAEQPTEKIEIVDDSVIVAGTDQVGLNQRFVEVVHDNAEVFRDNKLTVMGVGKRLATEALNDFRSTGALRQQADGKGGTYTWVEYGALLAFWKDGQGHLIEFSHGTFQPEVKTDKGLWSASMGSGIPIADPFLGMMRKAFCTEGPPQLATGRFITFWTLSHTIDVNTGGINGPASLAVLSKDKGQQPHARRLSDEELQEHIGHVKSAYAYLATYPKTLEEDQAVDLP